MKILGIDLGTNSIGLTLRNDNFFEWYAVYRFKKGVGTGKSGEFSLAAERTSYRSSRRLYNARRYRKWQTLKILIENDFCPLPLEKLNQWKNYKKGIGRVFPVDDIHFSNWIKLDFNNDGQPDYTSPYQLRRDLIKSSFDLSIQKNRYKLGRALYHIAQRRGFKSSRKQGVNEKTSVYKGSKKTKTIGRNNYENLIIEHQTLGAAFAHLEDKGIRIRNRYTLRSDYFNEVTAILEKQNTNSDFNINIKQAIFYQRPLRSQKGLIGKCTMEQNKFRCPISHLKFEEYRAWCFVNNIKYKENEKEEFKPLPLELKKRIVDEQLHIKSRDKTFKTIRTFIAKNGSKNWILNYKKKADTMSVSTCSVSSYLKDAFGEDWRNYTLSVDRKNKQGETYRANYSIEDIWHIVFSFEDKDYFDEFISETLKLSEEQQKILKKLWSNFPIGYANLSLKAINNILPFLKEGMIYSEAIFVAKIPELIGKKLFEDNKEGILEAIRNEIKENHFEKTIVKITNNLIAKYKGYDIEKDSKYIFAYKDYKYKLDDSDIKNVKKACESFFGTNTWNKKDKDIQEKIIQLVTDNYQEFFASTKRDYIKEPKLSVRINKFLSDNFSLDDSSLAKVYHPSMIAIYPSVENQQKLESPKTRSFKNPMAYKTLHKLKTVINYLLDTGRIDTDTRIVVEVAKELNDKNKRNAIADNQRRRERENASYSKAIEELINDPNFKGNANPNSESDIRKFRLWTEQLENLEEVENQLDNIEDSKPVSDIDIKKYRLWREQNCLCMYTGKPIGLTDLFDKNIIDFEHTIPRSKSFDNSLANLTVCYADFNRNKKGVKIPTQLENYNEIIPRLEAWEKKVSRLEKQIDIQKQISKTATDEDKKNIAIRKKHLLQFEYDYWYNKLDRFTREDIPDGFKNSQLIDTQIISKYALHYLKTIFNKVNVVKGSTTAEFRKIYKIQEKGQKKDRSNHSHHAIDAAVLTLIPTSAKVKRILQKAYEYYERTKKQYHETPFDGFKYSMFNEIKETVLINNLTDQDRKLLKAKKYIRSKGKIKKFLDGNGNKTARIATGDAVRGELHQQTFYGKIKNADKDENGTLRRDKKGMILYKQKNGKDETLMVLRKPIEKIIDGKNINTRIIVDEALAIHIEEQVKSGIKAGEIKDFQGNIIRRVRCRVTSGRGFMDPDNVTIVKKQTYKSKKEYKNYYYADSGDNYMFGLYETKSGKREIKSINLLEAAHYSKGFDNINKKELFKVIEPVEIGKEENKQEAELIHIFEPGQKVLFFIESREEIKDLGKEDLSKRLYMIKRLHQASIGNMLFQYHLESRTDDELSLAFPKSVFKKAGVDGFSKFQTDFIAPRLLFKPTKDNFIIEGVDFTFKLDGTIEFLYY